MKPSKLYYILWYTIFMGTIVPGSYSTTSLPMTCNNGTVHQCICGTEPLPPNHDLRKQPFPCQYYIQEHEISVVEMRARHVNLEANLQTNENYESYFRRRIGQIVSSYCERQINECPGVTLKLSKESENEEAALDGIAGGGASSEQNARESVLYAEADESDPLLTQDNVVLLRVEKEGDVTKIQFVITKSDRTDTLVQDNTIDPEKIKIILGSQAVPLSRILGGIKLDSVRVTHMRREVLPSDNDNSRLITIVSIVGTFFMICYLIGIYKIIRICKAKRRAASAKRTEEDGLAATTTVPNYGTLKDEKKPSHNGSALMINTNHPLFATHYGKIDETVPPEDDGEPRHLTDRQAKFMFMCDPSQLPREPTFDSQLELSTEQTPDTPASFKASTPPKEATIAEEKVSVKEYDRPSAEKELPKQAAPPTWDSEECPQEEVASETAVKEATPPLETSQPTLAGRSHDDDSDTTSLVIPATAIHVVESPISSPSVDSPLLNENKQPFENAILLGKQSPPPDRPRSRRGSRIDEEEIDMTELGKHPMFTDLVIPDGIEIAGRPESADRWSSSDGEVDIYYKLSDEEEIKADDWNHKVEEREGKYHEGEETDEEQDHEEDTTVYERLREEASPMPPREE